MKFFRSREERIHDEAASWIARIQADPDPADLRAFISWYNADERRARAYDELARLWHLSPGSSVRSPLASPARSANEAKAPVRYAIAAVLVAGIGLATLLVTISPPGLEDSPERLFLIATTVGEIREVQLADGSRVTLDTASELSVGAGRAARRLELRRGRARIKAVAGAKRLVVQAGAARVEAAEAVFDVSLNGGPALITSVSGEVSVDAGHEASATTMRLLQDQTVLVSQGEVRRASGPRHSASWPSGMLEFDAARLDEVVAQANRYSRTKLRLAEPGLGSLRVTGAFRATDIDTLGRSLAAAFDLELDRAEPRALVLRRARR